MCYCCRYSIFGWLFILCKRFVQCDSFIYRHHLQKGRLRWMPVFKFLNCNDSCSFPIFIIFYFSDVSTLWKKKKRVELVTGTVATNTDRNEAYIPKKKKKTRSECVIYIERHQKTDKMDFLLKPIMATYRIEHAGTNKN